MHRDASGALGELPDGAAPPARGYAEFDHPDFHDAYVKDEVGDLASIELHVEGVHCAGCVRVIERLPVTAPAVAEARMDIGRSVLTVTWHRDAAPLSSVARAVAELGYPPHPYRRVVNRDAQAKESRAMLAKIGVAFACMGNVMLMAFALYGGWFDGMEAQYSALFRWGSLVLTIPSIAYSATPFFRGAISAFRTRVPHMDLPVSLGILVGFVGGAVNVVRGAGDVYFDSVTALVFLLLLGRWLQQRQQRAALDAAELLHSLTPSTAHLVDGDTVRDVPATSLTPGAVVEVRAGEDVPIDGTVISGHSSVDAKLLTGESRPEALQPDSPAYAGCTNLSAKLLVRVEKTGVDTRVGQLTRSMEEASGRRAPVVALANRIAGYFVTGVIGLAAVTFALWWSLDGSRALEHTIALLVVTCPCALGIATPLAVGAAMGRAARRGILVKGGAPLELLSKPALVVFDKTGTLTEGALDLVHWAGDEGAKPLVQAVEAESSHPIARALSRGLAEATELEVSDRKETLGRGVEATVGGRHILVGSPAFVTQHCEEPPSAELSRALSNATSKGLTPVLVAVDHRCAALAALGDPIREDAAQALADLQARGHRLVILSGDHPDVVSAVADQLGVSFETARGGVSPEGKLEFVEEAVRSGRVVVVGDGVNDAAALAAASVGIAVQGSAEASLRAADVFITQGGLRRVVELFDGAKRTAGVIRQNLVFSLFYNLVGAALAVAGAIGPLVAAILMPASSLTVVTNSYRSRTFRSADE